MRVRSPGIPDPLLLKTTPHPHHILPMPIKIKGMSYRPVQLPELRDAVFYGQVKTYTDSQRLISPSMQAAISTGTLAVIEETAIDTSLKVLVPANIPAPAVQPVPEPVPQPVPQVSVEDLADKVVAAVMSKMPVAPVVQPTVVAAVTDTTHAEKMVASIDALAKKIDGMVVSGPGVSVQKVLTAEEHTAAVADVFVPTIRVDDMSNNIKLESRNLGQGGQVNSALAALRKLQQNKS